MSEQHAMRPVVLVGGPFAGQSHQFSSPGGSFEFTAFGQTGRYTENGYWVPRKIL